MNALHITGKSPLLMRALNAAIQAAPYDVTVLVTGENGTGKDYFYKILHNGSRRRFKKCIAVNCGGLPEGTIDSELFGHVKGAYTGAVGERKGYFEEADGGTIFLDEVGDLPMSIQAKLLRVLETGEIIRMGSSEVKKVDVRIVAATLQRYLPQFVSGVSVGGGSSANSTTFDPGEKQRLYMILAELHRQMEEVRERLGLHDNAKPTPRSLPAASPFVSPTSNGAPKSSPSKIDDVGEAEEVGEYEARPHQDDYISLRNPDSTIKKMADVERETIEKTVKRNNGNKRQAAKDLDISERTIHRKISDSDLE